MKSLNKRMQREGKQPKTESLHLGNRERKELGEGERMGQSKYKENVVVQ